MKTCTEELSDRCYICQQKPDIAVGTSILARHVSNPKQADWTEVKRIFRYLNKTKEKKLRLGSTDDQSTHQLIGYADADWGGDAEERKSNTGYDGVQISWSDDIMDKSETIDGYIIVNYIALAEATQEAMYLCRILKDLNQQVEACIIYEDNQSCIKILQNDRLTSRRTKHIDTKFVSVHALVHSRLDYCNSVLTHLPRSLVQQLQSVLNSAARLIFGLKRFDHITPALMDLHWLPYPQRITYKLCMIMFKCLRGAAPAYLADYCTSTSLVPGRSALRSASHGDIVVPSHRTDWGLRSFAVAGPSSWNALPVSLRSSSFSLDTFAKHLKTHLFGIAYSRQGTHF